VEFDKIKSINFDIIANDLSQDAHAAVRGFRLLRAQEFFKKIDTKKQYVVWADCGKHFRNNELVGYLFKEIANENIAGEHGFTFLQFSYCSMHTDLTTGFYSWLTDPTNRVSAAIFSRIPLNQINLQTRKIRSCVDPIKICKEINWFNPIRINRYGPLDTTAGFTKLQASNFSQIEFFVKPSRT
jgi:hypothetical protein